MNIKLYKVNPAIITLFSVLCVNIGSFMVIPFYTVYFHQHYKITLFIIGLALSISILTTRIISLLAGMLIDRLATKVILFSGLQICSFAYFGLAHTQSGINLIFFSFAFGLGNALFTTASKVLLLQIKNTKISKASLLSLRNIMLNCGAVIGPLIGSLFINNSAKILFLIVSLFYCMIGFFIVIFIPNHNAAKLFNSPTFKEIGHALLRIEIIPLLFLSAIFMFGYCQIQLTIPLFANHISMHWGILSVYVINAALIAVASLPISSFFIKEHSAMKMSLLGVFFVAVSFVLLYFTSTLLMLIISVIVLSFGEILFFPAADLAASKILPNTMTGTAMGVIQLAYGAGGVIGNLASGYLFSMLSTTHKNLFWLIVASFIFCITFFVFVKTKLSFSTISTEDTCQRVATFQK